LDEFWKEKKRPRRDIKDADKRAKKMEVETTADPLNLWKSITTRIGSHFG